MKLQDKPFFKMTAREREQYAKQLDREILLEDTRPLSPQGKALWRRAKRASQAIKKKGKTLRIVVDSDLLKKSDEYARRHGLTRNEVIEQGLARLLAG